MATGQKQLTVEQCPQGQQRVNRNQRLLADHHPATRILIEHPGWEDDLVTIRQLDLNDVRPEAGAGANYAYGVAEVWQVGMVNARDEKWAVRDWLSLVDGQETPRLACDGGQVR